MARALLRSSINGPSPNNQQHLLRAQLEYVGFARIGTGSYEGDFATYEDALAGLQAGIDFLANLPAGFRLDHLWIYVDTSDYP